jgi:hypothetical protein
MRNEMTPSGIEPVTFQACSVVSQQTAPPRVALDLRVKYKGIKNMQYNLLQCVI